MRNPERLIPSTRPNAKSPYATSTEEPVARQTDADALAEVLLTQLPPLLERFARLTDPRRVARCRHRVTVLLVYAIFLFLWQFASRREAHQTLSNPPVWEGLRAVFPELDTIPHTDTVARLFEQLDPVAFEDALRDTISRLLRKRKFQRWMVQKHYLVVIDGSQKGTHDAPWVSEALRRKTGPDTVSDQVYVVEAILTGPQVLTIPLMAEFCENEASADATTKQDCELKAFHRLAMRLKAAFPRVPFCLLLDGLYPNGPLIARCRPYRWDFLIVWQDGNLQELQEDAQGLHKLLPQYQRSHTWGNRRQRFWWVNDLEYAWQDTVTRHRRHTVVHYVVCEETWQAGNKEHSQRWVWLSSAPITAHNVLDRCNRMARHRWDVEEHLLVEKHCGYHDEHLFSKNWTAIKNWHTGMRFAHLLNVLILGSVVLWTTFTRRGMQGTIRWLYESWSGNWLDPQRLARLRNARPQRRLVG